MWVGGSVSCSLGSVPHIRPHPTRGGRRAGGPPALRSRFEVGVSHSLGSEPHIPHPPQIPSMGGAGLGVPPPPSGQGLRLAFLILRGQYWGRCWGLSPTSPPIPPTGSAGLGVPPPSALGSDPPLWGRSAPTPPFRDPISPFCISSVQRTNRALFSATAFLSVPASPHGVWGCSGAEGSGWDRA